jgi:hypothetical protein
MRESGLRARTSASARSNVRPALSKAGVVLRESDRHMASAPGIQSDGPVEMVTGEVADVMFDHTGGTSG